jgi:crossover junction endodeoxyribonuclease RuvC
MMLLAIDPGVTGAFALLGEAVAVDDLPIHQAQHGRSGKVRAELDLHSFRNLITSHAIGHVLLERVTARPGQGVTSMFRFGEAAGALYGLIVGLGLPVTFVTPQQWQKHHRIGASPDAARQRAVQLYPGLAPLLARKRDHHRADALLLARYGLGVLSLERAEAAWVGHLGEELLPEVAVSGPLYLNSAAEGSTQVEPD